jgi:nitroreductase
MDGFLALMERRWACKLFDAEAPLDQETMGFILECGRLSPSSFGLEHWQFHAVLSREPREALFEACFRQECVRTAALVVAITVRREAAYLPGSPFVRQRAERFPGGLPVFHADYDPYHRFLTETGAVESWASAQSYIPLANMMTGAAAAGVDSCAIEGFEAGKVLSILGLSPEEWALGILAVFGYPAEPRRPKIREPLSRLVTFL